MSNRNKHRMVYGGRDTDLGTEEKTAMLPRYQWYGSDVLSTDRQRLPRCQRERLVTVVVVVVVGLVVSSLRSADISVHSHIAREYLRGPS